MTCRPPLITSSKNQTRLFQVLESERIWAEWGVFVWWRRLYCLGNTAFSLCTGFLTDNEWMANNSHPASPHGSLETITDSLSCGRLLCAAAFPLLAAPAKNSDVIAVTMQRGQTSRNMPVVSELHPCFTWGWSRVNVCMAYFMRGRGTWHGYFFYLLYLSFHSVNTCRYPGLAL